MSYHWGFVEQHKLQNPQIYVYFNTMLATVVINRSGMLVKEFSKQHRELFNLEYDTDHSFQASSTHTGLVYLLPQSQELLESKFNNNNNNKTKICNSWPVQASSRMAANHLT